MTAEEYLHADFEEECEYIDGELVSRKAGEFAHAEAVSALRCLLHRAELRVLTSWTMQISATRIPDITVLRKPFEREKFLTRPPYLVVEVLARDEAFDKLKDYVAFGSENVWAIDPESARAWTFDQEGAHELRRASLTATDGAISVALNEIFANLF